MQYNNKILAIDDDPYIIDVYQKILSKPYESNDSGIDALSQLLSTPVARDNPNFSFDSATQGEEGYHKVLQAGKENKPYSLVFIDMRIPPGWDGLKTAREIRKVDKFIQIVIITAFSEASISDINAEVGYTERLLFLKKPFDVDEILQMADSLCMRWNTENRINNLNKTISILRNDFISLKTEENTESGIIPMLHRTLQQLSAFLVTTDILIATSKKGNIVHQEAIGNLVDFSSSKLMSIFTSLRDQKYAHPEKQQFSIDSYLIFPLECQCFDEIIVLICKDNMFNTHEKLLNSITQDMNELFFANSHIFHLHQKIQDYQSNEIKLLQKIKVLEEKCQ